MRSARRVLWLLSSCCGGCLALPATRLEPCSRDSDCLPSSVCADGVCRSSAGDDTAGGDGVRGDPGGLGDAGAGGGSGDPVGDAAGLDLDGGDTAGADLGGGDPAGGTGEVVIDLDLAGTRVGSVTTYQGSPPVPVNDTLPTCGPDGPDQTLRYTVQSAGGLVVDTLGSTVHTALEVAAATGARWCSWQSPGPAARVIVPGCVVPGEELIITVDADSWSAGDTLSVRVAEAGPPLLLFPADGAVDVPPDVALTATFGTPLAAVGTILLSGDRGTSYSFPLGTPEAALGDAGLRLVITPPAPLVAGETVTVSFMDVADPCDNAVTAFWLFQVRPGGPLINEVDPGLAGWIELYNPTGTAVDLGGWTLDFLGLAVSYLVPVGVTLAADGYLQVRELSGSVSPSVLYTGFDMTYLGAGAVALRDSAGVGVDFVSFGSGGWGPPPGAGWTGADPPVPPAGQTLARDRSGTDTDAATDWDPSCGVDAANPTPGVPNYEPPVLQLISPNGGEIWTEGETQSISWFSSGVPGAIDLDYVCNGGAYAAIARGAPNLGTWSWVLPAVISSTCVVQVQQAGGGGLVDDSDRYFRIAPAQRSCVFHFDGADPPWAYTNTEPSLGWTVDAYRATSGGQSLYYGDPALHSYGGPTSLGWAESPYVILDGSSPSISFAMWEETRSGSYDVTSLKLNAEGLGLILLWTRDDDPTLVSGTSMGGFVPVTVDLSPYRGMAGWFRFSFITIDAPPTALEGVYIDDVSIQGFCP